MKIVLNTERICIGNHNLQLSRNTIKDQTWKSSQMLQIGG